MMNENVRRARDFARYYGLEFTRLSGGIAFYEEDSEYGIKVPWGDKTEEGREVMKEDLQKFDRQLTEGFLVTKTPKDEKSEAVNWYIAEVRSTVEGEMRIPHGASKDLLILGYELANKFSTFKARTLMDVVKQWGRVDYFLEERFYSDAEFYIKGDLDVKRVVTTVDTEQGFGIVYVSVKELDRKEPTPQYVLFIEDFDKVLC